MIVNLNNSPVNLMPHLAPQFRFVCDEKYQSIKTIERAAEAKLPTKFGEFRIIGYRSLVSDEEFVVLTRGIFKPESPALVRIHSQCLTGDVFGSIKCDCGQQLEAAMKLIGEEDCGAIVYQQQEGRGIGIINKILPNERQPSRDASSGIAPPPANGSNTRGIFSKNASIASLRFASLARTSSDSI